MAIKSILCHMANDPQHGERLETAIGLAERFGAHLEVLYNTSPVAMPAGAAGRAASAAFLAELTEAARTKAAVIETELVDRFADGNQSHRYTMTEGDHVKVLANHAHLNDMVVVGQGAPKGHGKYVALHSPEDVALESGCPVLILPFDYIHPVGEKKLGKRVMVAWKNSKEAIRAVRESYSFLKDADEVHVVTSATEKGELAGSSIGRYLSHHDIHAEIHPDIDDHGRVGQQILQRAESFDCDLLVMGAYGHSRWREALFGGVTEYVLHHLDRPVLLAH